MLFYVWLVSIMSSLPLSFFFIFFLEPYSLIDLDSSLSFSPANLFVFFVYFWQKYTKHLFGLKFLIWWKLLMATFWKWQIQDWVKKWSSQHWRSFKTSAHHITYVCVLELSAIAKRCSQVFYFCSSKNWLIIWLQIPTLCIFDSLFIWRLHSIKYMMHSTVITTTVSFLFLLCLSFCLSLSLS